MVLSKEDKSKVADRELQASKAALKAHEEGQWVHEIVITAFEEAFKKFPEKEKEIPSANK